MRHYEIVVLIHPDQSEESQVSATVDRYTTLIKEGGGRIHRLEKWGKRQLCYSIQKMHKAFFVLMNIECNQETYKKMQESFRLNDAILRSLEIRLDQAVTEVSPVLEPVSREEDTGPIKVDYKNVNLLRNYITETGKIIPSRTTGTSAKVQRKIATAIRRARYLSLLPYCDNHQ